MAIGRKNKTWNRKRKKRKLGKAIGRKKKTGIWHSLKRTLLNDTWEKKDATEGDLKEKPQDEKRYIVFSEQVRG
jgi:hypothetical protein